MSEFEKKHEEKTDIPCTRTYITKVENRITFEVKTGYHLKLLTPRTLKLLGITKSKLTKSEVGEKCASFRNYWSSISPL